MNYYDTPIQRIQNAAKIFLAVEAAWWDDIDISVSEHYAFRDIALQIARVPARDDSDPGWAGKGFNAPGPIDA